jgi:DNA-binding MarR family transcriptional regulator
VEKDEKARLAHDFMQVISQIRRINFNSEATKKVRESEFRLLMVMHHSDSDEIKVSDLSTKMRITPAGVTHMTNSLERKGYIERLADPSDRRVVLVKLTNEGKAIIKEMKEDFLETLMNLISFLGERDSKNLLKLLLKSVSYFTDEKRNSSQ